MGHKTVTITFISSTAFLLFLAFLHFIDENLTDKIVKAIFTSFRNVLFAFYCILSTNPLQTALPAIHRYRVFVHAAYSTLNFSMLLLVNECVCVCEWATLNFSTQSGWEDLASTSGASDVAFTCRCQCFSLTNFTIFGHFLFIAWLFSSFPISFRSLYFFLFSSLRFFLTFLLAWCYIRFSIFCTGFTCPQCI